MPYCYRMHGIDELIEEFSDSNYSEGLCMSIYEYKDQEECYEGMRFFDVGFNTLLFTMSGPCLIFTKERDDEKAKTDRNRLLRASNPKYSAFFGNR